MRVEAHASEKRAVELLDAVTLKMLLLGKEAGLGVHVVRIQTDFDLATITFSCHFDLDLFCYKEEVFVSTR